MKKAKCIGTYYDNGIPYGMYEYLGESYEVCLNTFYSFKSIPEQHKEAQAFIESRNAIKVKTTPDSMTPERCLGVLLDWANGLITDEELDHEFGRK